MSMPSVSRSPVNSASPSRSCAVSTRRSVRADCRPSSHARCSPPLPTTFFHRDAVAGRMRAAAESQPLAVGPVLQVVPRRASPAARRSKSRTARSPPPRAAPSPSGTSSAASSSGACDQPRARHVFLERRVRIDLEQVERRVLGRERDRRVDVVEPVGRRSAPGSHIIRSRLTLSKPGRARLATAARARSAVCSRDEPPQLVVAERLDAEAEAIDARGAERREPCRGRRVSGLASSVTSASARDVERGRGRRAMMRRDLVAARAATASRRRRRSCRPRSGRRRRRAAISAHERRRRTASSAPSNSPRLKLQ